MFHLIKIAIAIIISLGGLGEFFMHRSLSKRWKRLPTVAAEILESKISHYNDENGRVKYEAKITFKYEFRGSEYVSKTPALRGPQLFPLWNYESQLQQRYSTGEIHNIRVVALSKPQAYLEVAPLSKVSIILMPLLVIASLMYLVGVVWLYSSIPSALSGSPL